MAKNDNLQDFLTDIADAIRAKKGITDKINPQDFSTEIASIQSGVEPKEMKDVNFYDYDGTILYSYTWDEALQLTEMPPLPDRTNEGLTCEGWNWTLEEMQSNEGMCDVGAIYYPTNGRTKLYLTVEEDDERNRTFYLHLGAWGGNFEGVIYWGDGEELAISHNANTYHTYSHTYNAGNYILELETITGYLSLGQNTTISVAGKNNDAYQIIGHTFIRKIVLSKGCMVYQSAVHQLPNLEYLIKPDDRSSGWTLFSNCKVKHINLPRTTTRGQIGTSSLQTIAPSGEICAYNATCMQSHHLKRFVVRVGSSAVSQFFHTDYNIQHIHGIKMTQLDQYTFYNNLCIRETPPFDDAITNIGQNCFSICTNLKCLVIPSAVTSIAQGAFANCYSMRYYDFTKLSAVPTLDNANAFTGIPADCEIRVPMALVDEWKAATNWSTYADYIVGIETIITFEDSAVEAICLANWDTNGTGHLSKEEARAVTTIGTVFKDNTDITKFNELEFFTNAKVIAMQSFYNSSLQEINLVNVTTIEGWGFRKCTQLINVGSLDNCLSIGNSAFETCNSLSGTIELPSITEIADSAFTNCTSLMQIDIGPNITSIGGGVFRDCNGLNSVIIRATTPIPLGSYAFLNTTCQIYVPDTSVNAYKEATNWSALGDRIKGISEMPTE